MASSFLLKRKSNLLTGFPFRQVSATNCLTSSGDTFRQSAASNRRTPSSFRSSVPPPYALISRFINCKESHVDVSGNDSVMFRQAAATNRLTTSAAHFRPTSSFCSSLLLTRSIIPFRRPSGALISRLIYYKEFHVDVSGHDSAVVKFMKRLRDKLDPFGWWYLVFKFDEENLLRVVQRKELFCIGGKITDEGVSIRMQMPGVEYHDMEVSVEGNSLFCKGIRALDYTHNWEFELPQKTYQPSDVKGKIQNGVLWVTFTNLKKEDMEELKMRHEYY